MTTLLRRWERSTTQRSGAGDGGDPLGRISGVGTLVTGNQSANHTHTGSVSANNTYVSANGSATTVTTTGGATRINTLTYTTPTGSFTTNGVSVNHNHAITGSTGGRSASHTHAITGGVSNSAASTTSPAVIPPALGLNYIIKT